MVTYFQWCIIMIVSIAFIALSIFTGMRFGRVYFIITSISIIMVAVSLIMMLDTRNRNRRRMNWERP